MEQGHRRACCVFYNFLNKGINVSLLTNERRFAILKMCLNKNKNKSAKQKQKLNNLELRFENLE